MNELDPAAALLRLKLASAQVAERATLTYWATGTEYHSNVLRQEVEALKETIAAFEATQTVKAEVEG
jgi:hypothetical protein